MTSVIRHLLPIRNSLPSRSTLSDVTQKRPGVTKRPYASSSVKTPALVYHSKGISDSAVSRGITLALR
jgi:hypothetical protein